MTDLFTVPNKTRQSPGLYIGRPSVSDLFMFLIGYEFTRIELGQAFSEAEDHFYENFQPWLQEKLYQRHELGKADYALLPRRKSWILQIFSAHGRVDGPGRSASRVTRWSKKIHHPSSELHPLGLEAQSSSSKPRRPSLELHALSSEPHHSRPELHCPSLELQRLKKKTDHSAPELNRPSQKLHQSSFFL